MSTSRIEHYCQAPCFQHMSSSLRGSRFSTWSALRSVQVATGIGRMVVESLTLEGAATSALGQLLPKMPGTQGGSS